MMLGGFAGRVLWVDLTERRVRTEPLDPSLVEGFIGGLGIAVRLAYDRMEPGCPALCPGNPIVVGAGPMVGTDVPASSRIYAVSKFPASGAVGWCGGGGMSFGCLLKNGGYDHVVIEGRSESPVFLEIEDDRVHISDAGHLWGMGVEETCQTIWRRLGRPAGVLSIGPAGENLISFSMAYIDRISTLGRGGFGAVMGSKGLKAIVVKGTKGVNVSDRKRYRALVGQLMDRIRKYPQLREWQELGLLRSLPNAPVEIYGGIKRRRVACVSCPIGDKDVVALPEESGAEKLVCSTSAVNLFTPMIYGFTDHLEAARCVAFLDELGLDMFEFFGLMAFTRTLVDNCVIPASEAKPEIVLNNFNSMKTWARKVCRREGLGELLAGGVGAVMREFGDKARPLAPPVVKGMLPYVSPTGPLAWDLFGTMELGQVLEPRGPHVATSGSPTYFAKRPLDVFPAHLNRMGVPPDGVKRILPGLGTEGATLKVGRLLRYSHRWFTVLGCLGICARAQMNRFYSARLCSELYDAVTGLDCGQEELLRRADRAWTMLRMANVREGFSSSQDALPEQWFQEPGFREYLSEMPLKREEAEGMVKDYYEEQGWDPRTGIPTPERLEELGLERYAAP